MTTATAQQTTAGRASLGPAAAATAVVCWGFGGVLIKLTVVPGLTLSLYRLWLGFLLMVPLLLVARRPLSLQALRRSLPAGVLFGGNVALFFSAVKLTSVANATLIGVLQPALVLLVAGRWFGERVGAREVGWTLVSIAGVALVVLGSAGTAVWSPVGDLLAVGALLAWTGYFLAAKRARARLDTLELMAGVMLVSAVLVTPVALLSGQGLRVPRPADWLWLVLFVLVPGAAGHLLMNWAHRYVDVSVSSLLAVGLPVVAAVSALVVLSEPLRPLQVLGGLVALAAIAVILRAQRRPAADPAI
jgi:drug/metabolite transporter (DMT)-like permease